MKRHFLFLLISIIVLIPSCAEEGDAVLFTLNLRFVTEEESDFFEGDTLYNAGVVTFIDKSDSFENVNGFAPDSFCTIDDVFYFSVIDFGGQNTILFGNGDQDTLFIDHIESLGKFQDNLNDAQGKLDFYYNGELIEIWDFDREPELGFGMRPICGWSELDMTDRPLVLTIVKKPQPEEFGN